MQIRVNEKRVHKVVNETVNGLNISVLLEASAQNTPIPVTQYMTGTGFDAANVTIDVKLLRGGRIYTLISSSLAVLAHFNTLAMGSHMWHRGIVRRPHSAGAYAFVERNLFVPFYGHHNVKGTDEMHVTVTVNRDAFNTGVNPTTSSILVTPNQSIGVETAIYRFHEHAIQANRSSEFVNLGDNVQRVALVSFETNPLNTIFRTASLSSDRLDWTKNEHELTLQHQQMFPYNYVDNLLSGATTDNRYYPNSFLVHDRDEIDQAKLSFNMNANNVEASKNHVCWVSFITSREILAKAARMSQAHQAENIAKIPQEA